jgi:hypothetical protein
LISKFPDATLIADNIFARMIGERKRQKARSAHAAMTVALRVLQNHPRIIRQRIDGTSPYTIAELAQRYLEGDQIGVATRAISYAINWAQDVTVYDLWVVQMRTFLDNTRRRKWAAEDDQELRLLFEEYGYQPFKIAVRMNAKFHDNVWIRDVADVSARICYLSLHKV